MRPSDQQRAREQQLELRRLEGDFTEVSTRGALSILAAMLAGLLAVLWLAACSSVPGPAVEVRVPVPVACVSERPAAPKLPSDAEYAAADDYSLVLGLWLDRRLRQVYIAQLEAVLAGCWQPRAGGM